MPPPPLPLPLPLLLFFSIALAGSLAPLAHSSPSSSTHTASNVISVVATARNTSDRLTPKPSLSFGSDFPAATTITLHHSERKQEILGFGGAFTEAAAVNFGALSSENKARVLDAYWGPNGIGYTLGRLPINSCDFSVKTYSFDDVVGDFSLSRFDHNVSHDQAFMIPLIKAAMRTSSAPLRLYGSPWSPPAWMKVPHSPGIGMNGSASPIGLRQEPEYQSTWAHYLSAWVSAYQAQGIPIWGMTVQNEPRALQKFESCLFTPESERDFVRDYLGPVLKRDHPSLKLMVWDHNKYNVTSPDAPLENMWSWASTIFSDANASAFVDGMAFHWYQIFEKNGFNFDILNAIHRAFPRFFLLNTEACVCPVASSPAWDHGELYGYDIIGDLNAWSVGWVDWNVLLDSQGGPNHVQNYCESPLMVDASGSEVRFLPQYYYLGQISKYVVPGSTVLGLDISGAPASASSPSLSSPAYSSSRSSPPALAPLAALAAERPDGTTVVVVQNSADSALDVKLLDGPGRAVKLSLPAHSIITLTYDTQ